MRNAYMSLFTLRRIPGSWLLYAGLLLTTAIYWPGLYGSWLFDDYPNIVDNHGVQPAQANLASLLNAVLSSPASEFKRPLASLSFAANYLVTGLDPFGWKLTNLLIHLLNGMLVFVLARALLQVVYGPALVEAASAATGIASDRTDRVATEVAPTSRSHADTAAALVAISWMLLPINLTGVLYVVQRMESLANLFVLLGLAGYTAGRRRMLRPTQEVGQPATGRPSRGLWLCVISVILPTAVGVLAKETAVMLPLYALLVECLLFRFRMSTGKPDWSNGAIDWRLVTLFVLVLALPLCGGLIWLLPKVASADYWLTRDFTLGTRLLSEARIVTDYIGWTILPTQHALSFYHDDFPISTGLLSPWTTTTSMIFLAALVMLACWLRTRRPLAALGIALFLGCHLLTGTILPLELIYEHRNYFGSLGLMLAIVPLLAVRSADSANPKASTHGAADSPPITLVRYALLAGLMIYWTGLTAFTAYAWGDPLRLAQDLASRAPLSPRAQYELGRTYIIYSHYDPASPFTKLAYVPLEKAAALPDGSILPEQALIFMNSRMNLPLKDTWWDSMIAKLKTRPAGVQDESSLSALTQCARESHCDLPQNRMVEAFTAALTHPSPSARLLASYGDYAWNEMHDRDLGERMTEEAIKAKPQEPAYQITLIRMLVAQGRIAQARQALKQMEPLNVGGRLNTSIVELHALLGMP